MAMMFAATHPERLRSLVLVGTAARLLTAPDYPIGFAHDALEGIIEFLQSSWATPEMMRVTSPELSEDPELMRWWITMYRSSLTPKTAGAQYRHILKSDVREALPLIRVPALVVSWTDNPIVPVDHARYLAEHIDGAQLVELPGRLLRPDPSNPDPFFDPVTEFLTGERPAVHVDRVLATVLFTDIVGSTQRAVAEGDRRWAELLEAHHHAVRSELDRYRGTEIDTAGDGFFATFDGPARAIRCACAIREGVKSLGLQIRAGVHTGEVERSKEGLRGLAIHIGARVGAAAGADEVLVSRTVADLVAGSDLTLADIGEHDLKGVPGPWRLFRVER
jgi:class 3 adenylate cyclase